MNKEHCPYCGSGSFTPLEAEQNPELSVQLLQCQSCGIMFTDLERRWEIDETPLEIKPQFDIRDEEATLCAANELLTEGAYNSALELLFQHKYPLESPLMFMVYRDICQAASALENIHILSIAKGFDSLLASEALLDLLDHNLQGLDAYLPDDEEQRFSALEQIHEALLFLCPECYIIVGSQLPQERRQELIDSVIQKNFSIMESFAAYLEALPPSEHRQEYLAMAKELWDKRQSDGGQGCSSVIDSSDNKQGLIDYLFSAQSLTLYLIIGLLIAAVYRIRESDGQSLGQLALNALASISDSVWCYIIIPFIVFICCIKYSNFKDAKKNKKKCQQLYEQLYRK